MSTIPPTTIYGLGLSTQLRRALMRNGVGMKELLDMTEAELGVCRGISTGRVKVIKEALAKHGLALRGSTPAREGVTL